jgi:dATP pyrophosphohydrolase
VTGSKDTASRVIRRTAAREVLEETGIDCRSGSPLHGALRDWRLENVYDIYPALAPPVCARRDAQHRTPVLA